MNRLIVLVLVCCIGCVYTPKQSKPRQQRRNVDIQWNAPYSSGRVKVNRVRVVPRRPCPKCPRGSIVVPTINDRYKNWGGGSCVFASVAATLGPLNLDDAATFIRSNFSGGETSTGIETKLTRLGMTYSSTKGAKDYREKVGLLKWCDRNNRAALIFFKSAHACTFLGVVKDQGVAKAAVLDPNKPQDIELWEWNSFLRKWNSHGSYACVILDGSPLPGFTG